MRLHVRVQLELVGLVSHREVTLSDPVAARLEGHLVPGQPALVAHHGGPVDGRAVDVVVDVAAQVEVLALVGRLDLAALLAGGKRGQGGVSQKPGLLLERRSPGAARSYPVFGEKEESNVSFSPLVN